MLNENLKLLLVDRQKLKGKIKYGKKINFNMNVITMYFLTFSIIFFRDNLSNGPQ